MTIIEPKVIKKAKNIGVGIFVCSTNKEARIIGTLSYLVEHQKLLFERGHSDQDLLIEQLIYILNRNINDDGPDALEGAVSMLQDGNANTTILSGNPRETNTMFEGYE